MHRNRFVLPAVAVLTAAAALFAVVAVRRDNGAPGASNKLSTFAALDDTPVVLSSTRTATSAQRFELGELGAVEVSSVGNKVEVQSLDSSWDTSTSTDGDVLTITFTRGDDSFRLELRLDGESVSGSIRRVQGTPSTPSGASTTVNRRGDGSVDDDGVDDPSDPSDDGDGAEENDDSSEDSSKDHRRSSDPKRPGSTTDDHDTSEDDEDDSTSGSASDDEDDSDDSSVDESDESDESDDDHADDDDEDGDRGEEDEDDSGDDSKDAGSRRR